MERKGVVSSISQRYTQVQWTERGSVRRPQSENVPVTILRAGIRYWLSADGWLNYRVDTGFQSGSIVHLS